MPKLAKVLGITTDELLTGKNDQVQMVPVHERKSMDQLTLHIKVDSAGGDKVRVNLPMTLVKVALEIGVDVNLGMSGSSGEMLKNVDMQKVLELVERGLIGKLVEVESANGDIVEIVVE